jgi:hypothetical protein
MKEFEYKLIIGNKGFNVFTTEVSEALNDGWKPLGGVAFNAGFAHQAMAKLTEKQPKMAVNKEENKKVRAIGANEAMRRLDL